MVFNYIDEEYRADWVERKRTVPREERPPNLEEVRWEFERRDLPDPGFEAFEDADLWLNLGDESEH